MSKISFRKILSTVLTFYSKCNKQYEFVIQSSYYIMGQFAAASIPLILLVVSVKSQNEEELAVNILLNIRIINFWLRIGTITINNCVQVVTAEMFTLLQAEVNDLYGKYGGL